MAMAENPARLLSGKLLPKGLSMRRKFHRPGFTLVELMISVAIALLLVLGVNTIFKITAQAVGAGESVLASSRDARTVLQTMLADVAYLDPCKYGTPSSIWDAPCFINRSEHISAFRNGDDYQAATDQANAFHDDNLFPFLNSAHISPVTFINSRSHRIDRLGFFATGSLFARQTSSDNVTYVAPSLGNNGQVQTGTTAWVVYGHSAQPNNNVIAGSTSTAKTDWPDPGVGTSSTNQHNFWANDWMLTRMAIIMVANPTSSLGDYIQDSGGGLWPLQGDSSNPAKSTNGHYIYEATLDLAGVTTTGGASAMKSWGSVRPGGIFNYTSISPTWWDALINYRFQVGPYMLT